VLARDFDGAIYMQRVSSGTGMVPDGPMFVLRVFGFFVERLLGTAIVLITSAVFLSLGLFRFIRDRMRNKKTAKTAATFV
jgi:hypothetical protein